MDPAWFKKEPCSQFLYRAQGKQLGGVAREVIARGPGPISCSAPLALFRGEGLSTVSNWRYCSSVCGRVGNLPEPGAVLDFPSGEGMSVVCFVVLQGWAPASKWMPFGGCLMIPCAHNINYFCFRYCKVALLHL